MFIASSSEAPGAVRRIAVGSHGQRHAVAAERLERRQLLLGESVESDRQHHRHRAGTRERSRVCVVRIFKVIARQCAVPCGHLAAADVRQLLGVQSHGQAESACAAAQRAGRHWGGGERDVLAVGIDAVRVDASWS